MKRQKSTKILLVLFLTLLTLSSCSFARDYFTKPRTTEETIETTTKTRSKFSSKFNLDLDDLNTDHVAKDQALLTAENFTIEDILQNGNLYNRREQFDPDFIEAALEYLPEIAGGNEFDSSIETVLRRWDIDKPIKVALFEEVTAEDIAVLDKIITPIEILTNLKIDYVKSRQHYNFEVYVTPLDNFKRIFNNYIEGNWGFLSYWEDDYYNIHYAVIAISNDYPNRLEMNHLLMEEFIQSLGLPNDSERYMDSIFQQEWTDVQEPSPIDWLLLEFIYRPELLPGTEMTECVEILRNVYLNY